MPKTRSIEKLPRYFHALGITSIIIFLFFAAFVLLQSRSIHESEQHLSQYHLPLSNHLLQLEHYLSDLQHRLSRRGNLTNHDKSDLLFQINESFHQISKMNKNHAHDNFDLKTLSLDHDNFFNSVKNTDMAQLNTSLEKFHLTTQQILLLNQQTTEKLSANLGVRYKQTTTLLITVTIIALLLGILLFLRIMTLIKKSITRQKKVEQELIMHQQHLEDEVSKRTHELESSNRELESYSYSIAHDLRAPLRSITSFSQIVMEDANEHLTESDKDHLRRVIEGGKRMAKLIDDLLAIARISRSDLSLSDIDLSNMAEEILHGFQSAEPHRNVNWEIQANLSVRGDTEMLRLALYNLLDNAWKYTANKAQAIIVFGCNKENNDKTFFVKDNGAGFDMQYADKLFTNFHRLHNPKDFSGNGIGLATVARIIHRHNGKIWADADVNNGATFNFTLQAV